MPRAVSVGPPPSEPRSTAPGSCSSPATRARAEIRLDIERAGGEALQVAAAVAFPLQGMYCAGKHAISGFTDALRIELEEEGASAAVTRIKPAAVEWRWPRRSCTRQKIRPGTSLSAVPAGS